MHEGVLSTYVPTLFLHCKEKVKIELLIMYLMYCVVLDKSTYFIFIQGVRANLNRLKSMNEARKQ